MFVISAKESRKCMPVPRYGALKGIAIARSMEPNDPTPHYQIAIFVPDSPANIAVPATGLSHLSDETSGRGVQFRVSVNVQARQSTPPPARVRRVRPVSDFALLACVVRLLPPWLDTTLSDLPLGFTPALPGSNGKGLDYVRQKLVGLGDLRAVPPFVPGPQNDLNDVLEAWVARAINNQSPVCAFGSLFGPEPRTDPVFGFSPVQGMHNVHRNQGSPNPGPFARDNGTYTDGALFVWDANAEHWVGLFLAFAGQRWRTNETGNPLSRLTGASRAR
jgi:uncharacterized protein YukJ